MVYYHIHLFVKDFFKLLGFIQKDQIPFSLDFLLKALQKFSVYLHQ